MKGLSPGEGVPRVPARTPAEERAMLFHCARVYIREARARRARHPRFADDLLRWAANTRRRAMAIDVSPRQMDMFG